MLLVPNANLSALVGKTDKEAFFVGNYYEGKMGTGRLYLSINDKPGYFDDNVGSLVVVSRFLK